MCFKWPTFIFFSEIRFKGGHRKGLWLIHFIGLQAQVALSQAAPVLCSWLYSSVSAGLGRPDPHLFLFEVVHLCVLRPAVFPGWELCSASQEESSQSQLLWQKQEAVLCTAGVLQQAHGKTLIKSSLTCCTCSKSCLTGFADHMHKFDTFWCQTGWCLITHSFLQY